MDLAICLITREHRTIKFSVSRNGIYIIHDDGDITNFSGDSVPVGGVYSKRQNPLDREYEMHEIKLKENDWVFCIAMDSMISLEGQKINLWAVADLKTI